MKKESITELITGFVTAALCEGALITLDLITGATSKKTMPFNHSIPSNVRPHGVLYEMNDGTLLYSNTDEHMVYGYNYDIYGNRWVETKVGWGFEPSNYSGGITHRRRYYIDPNGILYHQDDY
ncbi:MAG: hypothetical protein SH848_18070 [Saprospiraceae bacterium]|nr:hypothetical protein [Saprospiraceae bacterium]